MNTRKAGIFIAVLLLLASGWWVSTSGKPGYVMPVYGGKSAQAWFLGPTGHPGVSTTFDQARIAFDAMGTNCVPFLLDKAKARETSLNRFYCWLHPKLPKGIQARLKPPLKASYIQMIAYSHLHHLTMDSDFMANEILASVKMVRDSRIRRAAFESTESLAARTGSLAERKAYFLSFLNDSNPEIRLDSAITLTSIDPQATNGLAILLNAVAETNYVANALNSSWPGISPPHLDTYIRSKTWLAYEALRRVAPELADKYADQIAP